MELFSDINFSPTIYINLIELLLFGHNNIYSNLLNYAIKIFVNIRGSILLSIIIDSLLLNYSSKIAIIIVSLSMYFKKCN